MAGLKPPPIPRFIFNQMFQFKDLDAFLVTIADLEPSVEDEAVFGGLDFIDDFMANKDLLTT